MYTVIDNVIVCTSSQAEMVEYLFFFTGSDQMERLKGIAHCELKMK
jgi:hypothetical protein